MLRRLAIVFLLLPSVAPGQDSLVRFSTLKFTSEFERKAFSDWFKGKNQSALLDLLLSTDLNPSSVVGNAHERIEQLSNKLSADPSSRKKPEKYVKTVYDQVHRDFLKKYELVNRFPEVFRTGNYNCVTATALYALVFDRLGIPYSIQEKPTHVYLVAYPNQNNILVETTAPVFGYLTFDQRYKQKFVEMLVSQKMIGDSEFQSMNIEELFNKYFFQNENITLPQLVGIHYFNDALYLNDKQEIGKALEQIDKAYLFYPTPRTRYVMMTLVVTKLANEKPKPLERASLIARASQFTREGITSEMIKGEFAQLTEIVLTRDNNKPLYRQCFEIIFNSLTDPELKSDIAYYYYFELGRQQYNQGSPSQAKYNFALAMKFQPNNAELGQIFTTSLALSIRNETEPQPIIDTLTRYQERFPNLKDNNNFQSMLATSYLMGMEEAMDNGQAAKGEGYKARFEAMHAGNPDLNTPGNSIGSAYSAAASYYFKKGQKAKARAILDQGLKMAPENYELRRRKQMIN